MEFTAMAKEWVSLPSPPPPCHPHTNKQTNKSQTWNWVNSSFSWSSLFCRSGCSAVLLGSSVDRTVPACSKNVFTVAKASRNRLTCDRSSCRPWMCCDSSWRSATSRCSMADCLEVSSTMVDVPMFFVSSSLRRYRADSWVWISSNSCWRAWKTRWFIMKAVWMGQL